MFFALCLIVISSNNYNNWKYNNFNGIVFSYNIKNNTYNNDTKQLF